MIGIVILIAIGLYVGYVIFKKVKNAKEGNYCGCGCGSCPSSSKCHTMKE